jgi:hypothetical protein
MAAEPDTATASPEALVPLAPPAISRLGRMPAPSGEWPGLMPPFVIATVDEAATASAAPGLEPIVPEESDDPPPAALATWDSAADQPAPVPSLADIEIAEPEAAEPESVAADATPYAPDGPALEEEPLAPVLSDEGWDIGEAPPLGGPESSTAAAVSDRAWLDTLDWDDVIAPVEAAEDREPPEVEAVADFGESDPAVAASGDEAATADEPDASADPMLEEVERSADEVVAGASLEEIAGQVATSAEGTSVIAGIAEASASLTDSGAAMPEAFAGVFHEVADRLDNISASLRRRSAGEPLSASGKSDPLELLLTGFVLGYIAKQGNEPRQPGGS